MNEIIAVAISIATIVINLAISLRKQGSDKEVEFRDDLLERMKLQDDKIDAQNQYITTLEQQIKKMQEEHAKEKAETIRQVSNWRDSYYLALEQLTKQKQEFSSLKSSYDALLTEHQKLVQKH